MATGNGLLPNVYLEGDPLHPSCPAGHAAIAGACATIMKAMFQGSALVSPAVTVSPDGTTLSPHEDDPADHGGEINKLAFNQISGRMWAGIHHRSDADDGLAPGEEVAICFFQDQVNTFTETFSGFTFTKFDGTTVNITTNSGAYAGLNVLTPGS